MVFMKKKHGHAKRSVSILIPAHNEEGNIKKLVDAIVKKLNSWILEIVIVDDVSTDSTAVVVDGLSKKYPFVKVIHRTHPCGVGRALKDGFAHVSKEAKWVLMMDADFLTNIDDAAIILEKGNEGYDVVIGSRFIGGTRLVGYPKMKLASNRTYHTLANLVFGTVIHDFTNNFKLFKREVIDEIQWRSGGFAINAETGLMPAVMGYRIAEVPVTWVQRTYGRSNFKILAVAPSYLGVILRAAFFKIISRKKK